jgi:hypothetical protein
VIFVSAVGAEAARLAFRALRRFKVTALRRRDLAGWPLALERRGIVHPAAKNCADFQVRLQQGFGGGDMGTGEQRLLGLHRLSSHQ